MLTQYRNRLCKGASNNRCTDRLENPLHKQNKSALTTSLGKQRGGGREEEEEEKLRKRRKREKKGGLLLTLS